MIIISKCTPTLQNHWYTCPPNRVNLSSKSSLDFPSKMPSHIVANPSTLCVRLPHFEHRVKRYSNKITAFQKLNYSILICATWPVFSCFPFLESVVVLKYNNCQVSSPSTQPKVVLHQTIVQAKMSYWKWDVFRLYIASYTETAPFCPF